MDAYKEQCGQTGRPPKLGKFLAVSEEEVEALTQVVLEDDGVMYPTFALLPQLREVGWIRRPRQH
eukprot:2346258-Prorocentrum_lima.AAC.1